MAASPGKGLPPLHSSTLAASSSRNPPRPATSMGITQGAASPTAQRPMSSFSASRGLPRQLRAGGSAPRLSFNRNNARSAPPHRPQSQQQRRQVPSPQSQNMSFLLQNHKATSDLAAAALRSEDSAGAGAVLSPLKERELCLRFLTRRRVNHDQHSTLAAHAKTAREKFRATIAATAFAGMLMKRRVERLLEERERETLCANYDVNGEYFPVEQLSPTVQLCVFLVNLSPPMPFEAEGVFCLRKFGKFEDEQRWEIRLLEPKHREYLSSSFGKQRSDFKSVAFCTFDPVSNRLVASRVAELNPNLGTEYFIVSHFKSSLLLPEYFTEDTMAVPSDDERGVSPASGIEAEPSDQDTSHPPFPTPAEAINLPPEVRQAVHAMALRELQLRLYPFLLLKLRKRHRRRQIAASYTQRLAPEVLTKLAMFKEWPAALVESLAKEAVPTVLERGEFVCYEGELSNSGMQFLCAGSVDVANRSQLPTDGSSSTVMFVNNPDTEADLMGASVVSGTFAPASMAASVSPGWLNNSHGGGGSASPTRGRSLSMSRMTANTERPLTRQATFRGGSPRRKSYDNSNGTRVRSLNAPQCFGEFAFLTEEARLQSVRAATTCHVCTIPKAAFMKHFEKLPPLLHIRIMEQAFAIRAQNIPTQHPLTVPKLEQHALFGNVPRSVLREIARDAKPMAFQKGSLLTRVGEDAKRLIILVKGKCGVFRKLDGRTEIHILSLWGPEVIGDDAVVFNGPYVSSIRCLTHCDAYILRKEDLELALGSNPQAAEVLTRNAEDLREATLIKGQHKYKKLVVNIPILRDLVPLNRRAELVHRFVPKIYQPRHAICSTAHFADRLVIHVEGQIRIGEDEGVMEQGECIGFTSLVPHRWKFTAITTGVVKVLELPVEEYEKFVKDCGVYDRVVRTIRAMMFPKAVDAQTLRDAVFFTQHIKSPPMHPHSGSGTVNQYENKFGLRLVRHASETVKSQVKQLVLRRDAGEEMLTRVEDRMTALTHSAGQLVAKDAEKLLNPMRRHWSRGGALFIPRRQQRRGGGTVAVPSAAATSQRR